MISRRSIKSKENFTKAIWFGVEFPPEKLVFYGEGRWVSTDGVWLGGRAWILADFDLRRRIWMEGMEVMAFSDVNR